MSHPQELEDATAPSFSAEPSPAVRYTSWQSRIQMASDLDRLTETVRDYVAGWRYDELRLLPPDVSVLALARAGDLAGSAVVATQLELKFDGDTRTRRLLQEMALTLRAAASRFRFLTALRSRESQSREAPAQGPAIVITEQEVAAYMRKYPALTRTEVLWTIARHGPARGEVERALEDIVRRKG
jgi:hypothetical protein